jgi:hypothetical protein
MALIIVFFAFFLALQPVYCQDTAIAIKKTYQDQYLDFGGEPYQESKIFLLQEDVLKEDKNILVIVTRELQNKQRTVRFWDCYAFATNNKKDYDKFTYEASGRWQNEITKQQALSMFKEDLKSKNRNPYYFQTDDSNSRVQEIYSKAIKILGIKDWVSYSNRKKKITTKTP